MTTTFTEGVQASLAPWGAPGSDWQNSNAALAAMFETVYGLVSDQGSPDEPSSYAAGWSTLLNVETCPTEFLPYLGMFVGVFVPPGTDDATARARISNEQGFQRGTPTSITAAVAPYLSAGQKVTLQERTSATGSPDAYHFVLVVVPPGIEDVPGLTAAVDAVKPGGVQWTLIQSTGWLFDQAENTFAADTLTWNQYASTQP